MSFEDDTPSPSWKKRVRSAVASVKEKDKDRPTGSSFWDGSLNKDTDKAKIKASLSAPPVGRSESFGNKDVVDSSFMDLRSAEPGIGGSYGAKRASMKQSSKLEKVSMGRVATRVDAHG